MAQTIGERLQQARKARELTLEQASRAIHIREYYLEALESDQREALPSNVQGRGFLRLYAGLLDLNTAELLALWDGKAPVEYVPAEDEVPSASSSSTSETEGATGDQKSTDSPLPAPVQIYNAPFPQRPSTETEAGEIFAGSRSIFQLVGTKLREQRLALGLSLPEVERYTHLRVPYIEALEDGRLEDLPSPVQGRGMLSNYAAFLNLDEEKLLLRFAEGLQARRIERIPKPEPQGVFSKQKRPARQASFWRRFLTPDLIFGVGLVAVILFFALWTAARISALRSVETQPTPPGIVEILLTPVVRGTPSPTPGTAIASAEIPGPTVPAVEDPSTISGVEVTPLAPQSTGAQSTGSTGKPLSATMAPINSDPIQVYIIARQRAWLRVITDNKVKFLGRIVPGNAYAFSGSNRIELSTGNAAGLQVFYNQNDLGVLGISGEVVNLVFQPDGGLATPTLAFTATPTATRLATLTPLPSPTAPATPTITPLVPE